MTAPYNPFRLTVRFRLSGTESGSPHGITRVHVVSVPLVFFVSENYIIVYAIRALCSISIPSFFLQPENIVQYSLCLPRELLELHLLKISSKRSCQHKLASREITRPVHLTHLLGNDNIKRHTPSLPTDSLFHSFPSYHTTCSTRSRLNLPITQGAESRSRSSSKA